MKQFLGLLVGGLSHRHPEQGVHETEVVHHARTNCRKRRLSHVPFSMRTSEARSRLVVLLSRSSSGPEFSALQNATVLLSRVSGSCQHGINEPRTARAPRTERASVRTSS